MKPKFVEKNTDDRISILFAVSSDKCIACRHILQDGVTLTGWSDIHTHSTASIYIGSYANILKLSNTEQWAAEATAFLSRCFLYFLLQCSHQRV